MQRLVTFVEGEGDMEAVPLLLRRLLHEEMEAWNWDIKPMKAQNQFRQTPDRFLRLAAKQPDCAAVLVLLDFDGTNDQCAKESALELADRIRKLEPVMPVAVVFAVREYESWFLAGAASLAGEFGLPSTLSPPEGVEVRRNPKGWLTNHMSEGRSYKPTSHQARMTRRLDFDSVRERSRSFRRLCHAVKQLVEAANEGHRIVTPAA